MHADGASLTGNAVMLRKIHRFFLRTEVARYPIDTWNEKIHPWAKHTVKSPKALNDVEFSRGNDDQGGTEEHQRSQQQ